MKARVPVAAALSAAALLLAAAFPLAAAEGIGKITYLEGTVEIVRDEDSLDARTVKAGLVLENFDLLVTGADGEVELQIACPAAPPATLRVAPRTRFSLEIGKLGTRQQTTVGLMIGSVSVKCAKLTGSQNVKVQTDTALMGVRGTSFTVTAAASGDVLVDCDEGEVACTDEGGNEELVKPGEAVEKRQAERFRRMAPGVQGLEQFRRSWNAERIAALKADAPKAIAGLAVRYRALLAQFTRDFVVLAKAQKTIDRWRSEDRAGRVSGSAVALKEKKEVIGALLRLRKTLFVLERMHVRLLALKEYHDQGIGRGTITFSGAAAETTAQFFQRFERDRRDLERKMARVRMVARLFAQRNGGRAPTGAFDDTDEADAFIGE